MYATMKTVVRSAAKAIGQHVEVLVKGYANGPPNGWPAKLEMMRGRVHCLCAGEREGTAGDA